MKPTIPAFAAVAFLALAAGPPAEHGIRSQAEEGSELTLTFTQSREFDLDSMELHMVFGDQEMSQEQDVEINLVNTSKIVFADSYGAVDDGVVKSVTRTFQELGSSETQTISSDQLDEDQVIESESESELEGLAVVFNWDEDDEEYSAAWGDEGEADDDLLDELVALSDFHSFLPDDSVDVGDTWEVDADAYRAIFYPSGDLNMKSESDTEEQEELTDEIRNSWDGDIECELLEVNDADGVELATIKVTMDLSSSGSMEADDETPDGGDVHIEIEAEISVELEGELIWNLTAGHLQSAELSGDGTFARNQTATFDTPQGEGSQTQKAEFSGTISTTVEVE